MKRMLAVALTVGMLFSTFAGCSNSTQPTSPSPTQPNENGVQASKVGNRGDNTLKLSSSVHYTGIFNPVLAMDDYDRQICGYIYESLVDVTPGLEIEPSLAESWSVSEDSKSVTFHLRKDVKWHDGTPFTAQDVAFTFEFMCKPEHSSFYASNLTPLLGYEAYKSGDADTVAGIEVIDEYTIKLTTEEVFGPLLVKLGNMIQIMPKHIWENVEVAKAMDQTELLRNPIGTGPFKLKDFAPDEYVIVEANNDHWAGKPGLDSIMITIMNPETAQAAALNGEIDVVSVPTNPDDMKVFEDAGFKMERVDSQVFMHAVFNNKREILSDKRVRQALTYAVNRQGIVDHILNGYGEIAMSPYPSFSWASPEPSTLNSYEYNPEKALEILTKDVGWTLKDGVMYDIHDQPVVINLLCPIGNKGRELSAPVIQEAFKKLGIEVVIDLMELSAMTAKMDSWDFDMALIGNSSERDPDVRHFYHTDYIAKVQNRFGYSNPEADRLLEEGVKYVEVEARKPYYQQFAQIINEDCPSLLLYHPSSITAVNPALKEYIPNAITKTYQLSQWHFE